MGTCVVWSDEATCRMMRGTCNKVRRGSGTTREDPRFTVKTVKHPPSVMVWGAFSGKDGRSGLEFLPKNQTMNTTQYCDILERKLVDRFHARGCSFFMQDSAPCHVS